MEYSVIVGDHEHKEICKIDLELKKSKKREKLKKKYSDSNTNGSF